VARMQSDPFFAECRAYGRLQEQGVEHLAAKAYGYVKVVINDRTEEMFKPAMKMTGDEDSGLAAFMTHLYDLDNSNPPSTEPIYGIVKEWAGGDKEHDVAWRWAQPYEEQMAKRQLEIDRLPRQLENLHELHRNGIVMRDCHCGQWVNGVLVDLSHSWTVPHVLGQGGRHRPDWTFASYAARDLFMFQQVIDCQNESIDFMAGRLHGEGVHGPFRKSTLVAYSDDILDATEPFPRREGLRRLPHRLQQRQNDGWAREEDEDDEDEEELPLLLYTEPYDPDSEELPPGWAAWTHGPRWDPARFVSGKQRGHGKGDSDVLWGYIRRIKAAARRDRRSKLKAKSKAEAGVATKATTKPCTKANSGDKVAKKGGKGRKGSKKSKRA
jgi:kinetochore complex Sim4 subunit Fta2